LLDSIIAVLAVGTICRGTALSVVGGRSVQGGFVMRHWIHAGVIGLTLSVGSLVAGPALAWPAGGLADTPIASDVQQAQFIFGGRQYCWYDDGWRGPGFYWCGYSWRRGYGWGGGYGWHGWRGGHGHRGAIHRRGGVRPHIGRGGGGRPHVGRGGGATPHISRGGGGSPHMSRGAGGGGRHGGGGGGGGRGRR